MRGLAAVAVLALGCYRPAVQENVPCATGGVCPSGQVCDLGHQPPVCVSDLPDRDAMQPRLETCGDVRGLQANAPWPTIHGCPTNNGRSRFMGPATGATAIEPIVMSAAKRGVVVGAGNQIVIQERGAGDVHGFNGTSGMSAWTNIDSNGAGVEPTPVIDNENQVIFTTNYGKIYCIDYVTGAAKWELQFGGAFSAPMINTPGIVYFGAKAPYGVYAIDTVAKMQKWHYDVPGDAATAPALGNDKVYVVDTTNSRLYALDATTGAHVFDVPIAGQAVGSPVLAVDMVYVATQANGIAAVDAQTGEARWQEPQGLDVVQPALLANGNLVSSTKDGKAFILYRETGKRVTSILVDRAIVGSPVIDAADVIYFATTDGTYAFEGDMLRWSSPLSGPIVLGNKIVVVLPSAQMFGAIGP